MQEIPLIDIRGDNPLKLVEQYPDKALRLIEASKNSFGIASRVVSKIALPLGDHLSRRWLDKTGNPYAAEISAYYKILQCPGVFALNLCYEWGCTSGVYPHAEGMKLTRILDWPFPALGENMVVAHQSGSGGDFYNVTWPGVSGVFSALAPGRFAGALNQAPMRRFKTDIVTDWVRNRLRVHKSHALPPAHLLRKVFETACSYEEAKQLLAHEPLSIPVIYILSGTKHGEGCVIERLEEAHAIREIGASQGVCAANHFESHFNGIGHGWLPRAIDSYGRSRHGLTIDPEHIDDAFRWFSAPIANRLSRLAMSANAATGRLRLIGTNGTERVTQHFVLN